MFRKVLIANRGEIAVRIARTLREMGVRSVAVFSEPDAEALHVRAADEAVPIGGESPATSYLDAARVLDAARTSGAEAVHPGYGFLSESPAFARAVADAGLVFVGPPADVLARVGDKTAARRLALEAGVPIVPGSLEPARGEAELRVAAESVGYPVLVKAASGGGGRGMRRVEGPAELEVAARAAASEARAAFGDEGLYVERALERPRHVEVQVLGDSTGRLVHLFERDCSLQRRHQKIVEESPSPGLDGAARERLCEAAVRVARAAGYVNAGTVELLLDAAGEFFFLEVNARLQVEHPVTEMVTGLDLVRHQLELAAGAPLSVRQDDVTARGHAIECRIYAEDPAAGFSPSPGRVLRLEAPEGPGVRFDRGVETGSAVPVHYDPILAKLVVWAEHRPAAVERMLRALGETAVLGVATPVELLLDLIGSEAFRQGRTHTGLVEDFVACWRPSEEGDTVAALALLAHRLGGRPAAGPAAGAGPSRETPWQRLHGRGPRWS